MKKLLLPLFIAVMANTAFGQATVQRSSNRSFAGQDVFRTTNEPYRHLAAKNSSFGDTVYYYNNTSALLFDSSVALSYDAVMPNDTGYLFGTNKYGDNAFAEMYDFNWGQDTNVTVLGVLSYWAGNVNPSSADSVTFQVWGRDTTQYQLDTNIYAWNFPGASLGSQKTALTALNAGTNQYNTTWFSSPVSGISSSFYVGYSYSYNPDSLNGDTIALRCSPDGTGSGTGQYELVNNGNGIDTFLITRNAVRETDGYWYDVYNDYGYNVNLSLVPIFQLQPAASVHGVSYKGLTLDGCYPNPAGVATQINFSLAQASDASIMITDMRGKVLNTFDQKDLTPGSHSVSVPLSSYPSGNYIYIIHTSKGAAMAAMFSVQQ